MRPELSFGPFRLFPMERMLERDGSPVQIGGRALDLLICLTERPGEIVAKRDLMARAWPNLTIEENSLRFHIVRLRKTLGAGQLGARYITNVSGRGYCFVAPVMQAPGETAARNGNTGAGPGIPVHGAASGPQELPKRLDKIIGRDDVIRRISEQLDQKRFVTIHGPGGIGKTTVAIAVAHGRYKTFDANVRFLGLGAIADPSLVASALASALGIAAVESNPTPAVVDYLRDRRFLIVFDCCEHVVEAVADLTERLYWEAPRVSILATSRERLRVDGENAIHLSSLALPPADKAILASDIDRFPATQLFADRAAAAFADQDISDEDAGIMAGICRKLDGIALAIELVASQVAKYGIHQTSDLLDGRLGLLLQGRRTAVPRHQTLKASIDWSHELLDDTQKRVLQRLSIFVGSFTMGDAEIVGAGEPLTPIDVMSSLEALVEKSLVVVQGDAHEVRYRLLDTTKSYASEKLARTGEVETLAKRYAAHVVTMLRHRHGKNLAPASARILDRQLLGDASAALHWSFSENGDKALGAALAAEASSLFISLSMLNECRRWCDHALSVLPEGEGSVRTAMVLNGALGQSLMLTEGHSGKVRGALGQALELAERLDDKQTQFRLLCLLHMYHRRTGEVSKLLPIARRLELLANPLGDPAALSAAHRLLSVSYHLAGDQKTARTHIDAVFHLKLFEHVQPGHYAFHQSPNMAFAQCLWLLGYPDQATTVALRLQEQARSPDAVTYCIALIWGANVFQWTRDWKRVDGFAQRLISHARDHSLRPYQVVGLAMEGEALLADGQVGAGIALIRSSLTTLHAERFELYVPRFQGALALGLLKRGDVEEARSIIDGAIRKVSGDGLLFELPELLRVRGEVMAHQNDIDGALASFTEAMSLADSQGALSWRLRIAMSNVRLCNSLGRPQEALADLLAVYDRFSEGFATPDLVEARQLLNR